MATFPRIERTAKSGERLLIRHVEVAEAESVLHFFRAVAASTDQILTQADEGPQTVADEVKFITEMLEHPGRLLLVAEHAPRDGTLGELVGLLGVRQHERRRTAHAATLGLSVAAGWRGRGVGVALLQACLDWATAHPTIEKVCLEVFSTNAHGFALYRKLGFVEEGRRGGHAQITPGAYADEIMMACWVKPRGTGCAAGAE